jgi:glycerol-3-phosphate dehydrogenase (NAD(P)+)
MRISVLGAGSWGTTLAILLYTNRHDVTLWTYNPEHARFMRETRTNPQFLPEIIIPQDLTISDDLHKSVEQAEIIVSAIPTQFIRSVFTRLQGTEIKERFIVNVAKGIEIETLMTTSEVISDSCRDVDPNRQAILSGPSHAEEVSMNIPTAVVAASPSLDTARLVQSVFLAPSFRVYASDDMRGVELGGAIKNVIAIAAGISDGIGFGDNTKAAILTRGIVEITRLGIAMGANQNSFSGLSGIGDLIVTCTSKHSRNRYVGEQIGKGRSLEDVLAGMVMVAEGVATTKSVYSLSQKYGIELPISTEVYRVLFEGKDPYAATEDLMTRDARIER